MKTRILWDMDSCGIPKTYTVNRILGDFTQTVRNKGYEGTVDVYPVTRECGDVRPEHRSQLREAGVKLYMADCYGYTGKNAADNVIKDLLDMLEEKDNPALYVFVSCDSDYRIQINRLLLANQHVAVIHRRGRQLRKGEQVIFLANGKLETKYPDVLARVNFTAGWPLSDDIDAGADGGMINQPGADGGMINQPGTDGYLYLSKKLTEKYFTTYLSDNDNSLVVATVQDNLSPEDIKEVLLQQLVSANIITTPTSMLGSESVDAENARTRKLLQLRECVESVYEIRRQYYKTLYTLNAPRHIIIAAPVPTGVSNEVLKLDGLKISHKDYLKVLQDGGADFFYIQGISDPVEVQAFADLLTAKEMRIPASIMLKGGDDFAKCLTIAAGCNKFIAIGVRCEDPSLIAEMIRIIKEVKGSIAILVEEANDQEGQYIENWIKLGASILRSSSCI